MTHTADFKTLRLILPDAKPVPWKEVTGTFTVDFGKASVDKRRVRRSAETDPGIGDFFKNIGKDIKKEANKALDKAKDIGKDIKETADKAVEKAKSVVEKVPEKAKEVVKDVKEKAKPIADKVEEVVDKIDDKAKEVGEVVKDGIKKGVDEAKAILDSVLPDSGLEGELEFDLSIGERGKKVPVFQDFTGYYPFAVSYTHKLTNQRLSGCFNQLRRLLRRRQSPPLWPRCYRRLPAHRTHLRCSHLKCGGKNRPRDSGKAIG